MQKCNYLTTTNASAHVRTCTAHVTLDSERVSFLRIASNKKKELRLHKYYNFLYFQICSDDLYFIGVMLITCPHNKIDK